MTRAGLILAGGLSTRMGQDKALFAFDGRLLLMRTAMRLRLVPGIEELVVACGPAERVEPYARALAAIHDVPVRLVPDKAPDLGPLAGLAAGLANARADFVAVAPVDAPFLAPALVERLFALAEAEERDGAVVVREGRREALWGVFRRRTTAGHFRYALAHGERAPWRALEGLDLGEMSGEEAAALDPEGLHFHDLDAASDLPAQGVPCPPGRTLK